MDLSHDVKFFPASFLFVVAMYVMNFAPQLHLAFLEISALERVVSSLFN